MTFSRAVRRTWASIVRIADVVGPGLLAVLVMAVVYLFVVTIFHAIGLDIII